jgi:cation transport regulator ChaC
VMDNREEQVKETIQRKVKKLPDTEEWLQKRKTVLKKMRIKSNNTYFTFY